MNVHEQLLTDFKNGLDRLSISSERKSEAVKTFAGWVKDELVDPHSRFEIGLDTFFTIDKGIDERIAGWQDYYSKKPADCPDDQWPIFKRHEWVDKAEFGRTPLHRAVVEGDLGEIKELIKKGEDLQAKDNGENTPFELAVLEGQDDIVEWMLEEGLDK